MVTSWHGVLVSVAPENKSSRPAQACGLCVHSQRRVDHLANDQNDQINHILQDAQSNHLPNDQYDHLPNKKVRRPVGVTVHFISQTPW